MKIGIKSVTYYGAVKFHILKIFKAKFATSNGQTKFETDFVIFLFIKDANYHGRVNFVSAQEIVALRMQFEGGTFIKST